MKPSNIQSRTPNLEASRQARFHALFEIGCSMFDFFRRKCPLRSDTACLAILCLVLALMLPAARAAAPLPPSHFAFGPAEVVGHADLDGDGRTEAIIIDRVTGAVRAGFHAADGEFVWTPPRASGIYDVTGATAGRLLNTTRDAIAVTSPTASRVHLIDLPSAAATGAPAVFLPALIGPLSLGAGQIAGTSSLEDLALATERNGAPNNHRLDLLASAGGGNFGAPVNKQSVPEPLTDVARVLLKAGASHQVAYLEAVGATATLRVLALNEAGSPEKLAVAGLPPGSRYVMNPFAGLLAQLVTWIPGEESYAVHNVTEGPPGTFGIGAPATLSAGFPIGGMNPVAADNSAHLLILALDGSRALVRTAPDGADVQSFTPPPGEAFTGAIAADGLFNGFQMLRGPDAGGRSLTAEAYRFNPVTGAYGLTATVSLPPVGALAGAGHVLVYAGEPFVSPGATVLARMRALDWSSGPLPTYPGNVLVTGESFVNNEDGLGQPDAVDLGPAPAGATHTLVSQFDPAISIFSLSPAEGGAFGSVQPAPEPGFFDKAILVSLTGPAGWTVNYRTQPNAAWQTYTAAFWLHRDTVVEAFAQSAAQRTSILEAHYRFSTPAGQLSSLDDGIPDYVKVGLDLDPLQLPDRSGTSNNDETLNYLQILLEGSGVPNRNLSGAALDLHVRPHSHDGLAAADAPSLVPGAPLVQPPDNPPNPGNAVTAYTVAGEPLDTRAVDHFGAFGAGQAAAFLDKVTRDGRAGIVIASTVPSFALSIAPPSEAGPFVGRELTGIIPLPVTSLIPYHHAYGGGTDAAEAAAWKAGAIAHYLANPPPVIGATLDTLETAALLVFEQWLAERLVARELLPASFLPSAGGSDRLTLTGFRASETGAQPIPETAVPSGLLVPTPEQLTSLELYRSEADPGHRLVDAANVIREQLRNSADPDIAALRSVALEIYRISARWNGALPGAFPSPFDALREFLATAMMPRAYRNDWEGGLPGIVGATLTALGPADYAQALEGLATLLNAPAQRPVVTRTLVVQPDSAGLTCTVLARFDTGDPVSLIDFDGAPFRFPGNFDLVPGTRVRVKGFADAPTSSCAPQTLEVVLIGADYDAFVIGVPEPPLEDTDGNLLPDAWEYLYFGDTGNDPWAEIDDGYSLIQSYLDGTDPLNPVSYSSVPPASLQLPEITIEITDLFDAKLSWEFPVSYAHKFWFKLQSTPVLGGAWTDMPVVLNFSDGKFEVIAPISLDADQGFWRVALGLNL